MDNKEKTQEFSLEEIMQEFASDSPAPESPEEMPGEADSGEKSVLTDSTIALGDISEAVERARQLAAQEEEEAEEDDAEAEAEEAEETEAEPEAEEEPEEDGEAEPEEEAPEAEAAEGYELTSEDIPAPKPILFRSRLGELKRKLVAGPEKRYYDLSELGLGRVQAAIFASFLIVLLCAGGTALYAMGAVMENRLRLMVFSQVLAMMVSALLGCYVLLDGIVDLFTGKFSLNSMLFLTLGACAADAVFCLQELRVPCCAAFCLEMTMALWDRSLRRNREMGQMDTLRKATRLDGLVKVENYFGSSTGIVRTEGRVEDFMDHYNVRTGPEKTLNIFAVLSVLLCAAIAVMAGMRHNLSLAIQVFSTSMLVAVPAGAFVSQSRPAAVLQRRLHMVGTVICGWQGVKTLTGKASFPLTDRDIFPMGSTKLNGVKFLGDREPEEVIAFADALMRANGGSLEPVFTQLRKSRNGREYTAEDVQIHPAGGLTGLVLGEQVLMGTADFLKEMNIEIPGETVVPQAVYFVMEGSLTAVFAINYSRTKAAAGGLVTLGSYRKIRPLVLCRDFMVTSELLRSKFGIRTKRFDFPDRESRETLSQLIPDPEKLAGALTTQQNLSAAAYAVTGAKALRTASRAGAVIHIFAGIVGMLIMAALAYLGDLQLLSPINILLYQLVWLFPGLLITEWTRTV